MVFDDGRLDDPAALAGADEHLRWLASAGARLRIESTAAADPIAGLPDRERPRAVLALGPEARFLRAVLEPGCPVPFVAWQGPTLPGWVGALDTVVAMGTEERVIASVAEASRRGCQVIWACPPGTPATELLDRGSTVLPTSTRDPLVTAIVMLSALHHLGLSPFVQIDSIADGLDEIAEVCSVHTDLVTNPAKILASSLADSLPLVCGTSVLSARAARRMAEALRAATGQVVLAADARELWPVVAGAPIRDVFADPFDASQDGVVSVLVLDDELAEPSPFLTDLLDAANDRDIRISRIIRSQNGPVERYATMLQEGLFAAAFLRVGRGRDSETLAWHNRPS